MSNFIFYHRLFPLILLTSFILTQAIYGQNQLRYLEPKKKLTQYILDHWQSAEGLPTSNIRRVFQSKNGFLWMTGFDGLIRFDGVRFDLTNKKNQKVFRSNATYLLGESPDSTLWIGTHGSGLLSYKDGVYKNWGFEDMLFTAIWVENQDKIWLSGRGKGLFIFNPSDGSMTKMAPDLLDGVSINCITADENANIWIGTEGKGIYKYNQVYFQRLAVDPVVEQTNILNLYIKGADDIWVCTTKGLYHWQNGQTKTIEAFKDLIVYKIEPDLSGSFWIATSSGLYRRNILTKAFELLPYQKEAPLTNVLDLLLDREGSLWIATYRSGLFRLKDGKFNNFTFEDGLNTSSVGSVCELENKSILLGMNDGTINIIDSLGIRQFPIKTPLPKVRVFNIIRDSGNNLWISSFNKLLKIDPLGREKIYNELNGLPDNSFRVSFEDRLGNIWVGTRNGGVAKIDPRDQIQVFGLAQGLSSNFIMDINQDKEGNILVATNDGGLNIIYPDRRIKQITKEQGLESNLIFSVYNDADNVTWLACGGALSRVEGDQIFNFTTRDGLSNDTPFDVLEDQINKLWMSTSRGIVKVEKAQLNAYAQGKLKYIDWIVYDKHDGMKSEDCTGAAHSLKTQE
ncbi:MAG: two-component regulator propeller domain-containing protein, partial [Bacteroidota bacterium]